jgi:hypothetical protein
VVGPTTTLSYIYNQQTDGNYNLKYDFGLRLNVGSGMTGRAAAVRGDTSMVTETIDEELTKTVNTINEGFAGFLNSVFVGITAGEVLINVPESWYGKPKDA